MRDGIEARESTAIQNLLYIAVISRPAASAIVDLAWIRDGVNEPEVRAIDWISYIEDADALTSIIALDWVRDGIKSAEVEAIKNLSSISNGDARAGLSLLSLGWVVDGIDEPENVAISLIASSVNSEFSLGMISLNWVQDGINQEDVEAFRYVSDFAGRDAPLALAIASLGWIRDGIDDLEREALDWIGSFDSREVTSSVIALPWVQDGIRAGEVEDIELLSHVANYDASVGLALSGLGWIQDGLQDPETDAIGWIGNFNSREVTTSVIALPWVRDGIDEAEVDAIEILFRLENHDAAVSLELLSLVWVQDGLDPVEADATGRIGNFASAKVASSLVTQDWVLDGIVEAEVDAIDLLSRVESRDATIGLAMASLGWIRDGIDDLETGAIDWLGNFTSQEVASSIAGLRWFRDDIDGAERKAIEYLSYITNEDRASGRSLVALNWVQDEISALEADAIRWISNFSDREIASSVAGLSWVQDDIDDAERKAIEYLSYITNEDRASGRSLVALNWVQDEISALEADAIRWIGNIQGSDATQSVVALEWMADDVTRPEVRLIEEISYLTYGHPQEAIEIVGMPFLESVEPPDVSAVEALSDMSVFRPLAFEAVMSHPTIKGGITDDMTPAVATLDGVARTNRDLVNILLEPGLASVERRTVTLPLSGEVVLTIVRTGPGAARSMDLLEHSVRSVEAYMELPLPTSYVGLLYENAVTGDVAGTNFGTHMAILPEYDVDDGSHEAEFAGPIITHEVAHYYWRSNPDWIDEGVADFIASIVESSLANRPLDASNAPCAYASSIAELEDLTSADAEYAFTCSYSLGERLFLDLNRSLGESGFRQGLRQLYLLSEMEGESGDSSGSEIGIGHVRRAFNVDAEVAGAVIDRWYEGTEPYDTSSFDNDPVMPGLPQVNGRIDRAYVSLTTDGPPQSSFSVGDLTDWIYLTLKYSHRLSGGSRQVPLEIVEIYEDGFVFDRTQSEIVAQAKYIGGTRWFSVGSPPGEGTAGRYTIYVYTGDQKIAEVQFEVTR